MIVERKVDSAARVLIRTGLVLFILTIISPLFMRIVAMKRIYEEIDALPGAYTCLVPGALVYSSGYPSGILRDRLDTAHKLYRKGKVKRFLLSGDHGHNSYDEVNNMRKYLMRKGVPSKDIFLDHAGFNTYNSVVRAKKIFQVDTMIVATQKYHLPRAIFLGNAVGIHTTGITSDMMQYPRIDYYKFREYLAQIKAVYEAIFRPSPTFLGEEIPITGNSKKSHG